jgi:hypothetical protein
MHAKTNDEMMLEEEESQHEDLQYQTQLDGKEMP